ncbi:MAG: DUF2231 domain-containing protein [Streptosporangiaceae bacterium]
MKTQDPVLPLLFTALVLAAGLFPLKVTNLLGLPAHVLFLHVPVVLIPIVCVLVSVLAFRPAWRARFGLATALLATATMAATLVTVGAGEALRDARFADADNPRLAQHAELGEQLRLLVIVVTIAFILLLLADARLSLSRATTPAVGVTLTALAILTIVWVTRTGHLGAQLAWAG